MRRLVIEYVFEGHKRGYNFTSPTGGFNDDTLKTVWRSAMPRGQGWGAEKYLGARSLKCFKLPDNRIALSESIVTDQQDEAGRKGIRHTDVEIMQPGEYLEVLRSRLKTYSLVIQNELYRKTYFGERRRVPKTKGHNQLVLSYPYENPNMWQRVEAIILHAVVDEMDKRWGNGRVITFTTLALDYRGESQLVVVPQDRAGELGVDSHPLPLRG
jgi:hypothetical protein